MFLGYGGLPGAEALQGLGKAERARRGLRGGVVRLVFIMSWLAREGFQGSPRGDVSSLYPYMRPDLQVSLFSFHRARNVRSKRFPSGQSRESSAE